MTVVDRQGENVIRTVFENLIEARIKAQIGVSIGNVQDLTRGCHCSRYSGAYRQCDFKTFDFLRHERVKDISSTIDDEHGYPVDRHFRTNNVQYNLGEFLQFKSGIQQPGCIQERLQPTDLASSTR